jgi:hypothetical protein
MIDLPGGKSRRPHSSWMFLFRFYGPTKRLFDKSTRLNESEKLNKQAVEKLA